MPHLALGTNSFVRFTSFTSPLPGACSAKRIHRYLKLTQPHGCSPACPSFSSEFHIHFKTVSQSRWYFYLVLFFLAKGLSPCPGLGAGGHCRLLCQSRHELIRLAQKWAVIYEASPFLTFPLFMQCNFNVINTKRFTAGRGELPSFISAIKLLVPMVAFPFNCLLGWNPGF